MTPVIQVGLEVDLTEFTQFLWAHKVPHRVTEEGQLQTLWIAPHINAERVRELFGYWQGGGELSKVDVVVHNPKFANSLSITELKRLPVTALVIGLTAIITLLIEFGANSSLMIHFTFTDFVISGDKVSYQTLKTMLATGELWRIWSPMFMHFSMVHVLFNLLWIWMIGGAIERKQGHSHFLLLVLFSGAIANLAQFWISGPLFGGLSGVVFAVLGYTWLWDRIAKQPLFRLPQALFAFLIFWLALGYSGALEFIGLGAIANTAHLAGLVSGLAFALISKIWRV